jgi:hypothetical protein
LKPLTAKSVARFTSREENGITSVVLAVGIGTSNVQEKRKLPLAEGFCED